MKNITILVVLVLAMLIMQQANAQFMVNISGPTTACQDEMVTLTANVTGSTGPFTYQWSTGHNTQTIMTPAIAQTIGVTVTSADTLYGGTQNATSTLMVNMKPMINITASATTINSGETSTITVMGAQTYIWNTGQTTSNISVSPITSTVYTVTATGSTGCTNTAQQLITVNGGGSTMTVTSSALQPTICMGAQAEFQVMASGGKPPYSYLWDFGDGTTSTIQYANHMYSMPGTYTAIVTVSDSSGSKTSQSVITVMPQVLVNLGPDQNLSMGDTIMLSAQTGNASYYWSTGQTTQNIYAVATATTSYKVTVTSYDGCTASDEVIITVGGQSGLIVSLIPSKQTLCEGEEVSFVPSISGGTPPYTYAWSDSSTSFSLITNPLTSMGVSVTVTDVNNKTGNSNVFVSVYPKPMLDLGPDATIQSGQSVTLSANAGTVYYWSTGQTTQTIVVFPTAPENIYEVTVTNPMGCTATDFIFIYTMQDTTVQTPCITSDVTICEGQTITLCAAETDVAGESYFWMQLDNNARQVSVTPTTTTTYDVEIIKDTTVITKSITVTVAPSPTVDLGPDIFDCSQSTFELTANTTALTYEWDNGATTKKIFVSPFDYGWYTVTVTDANGCTASDYITVSMGQGSPLWFDAFPDTMNPMQLNFFSESYMDTIVARFWDFGDGNASSLASPSHIYSKPGKYIITLSTKNTLGCTKSATQTVSVGNVACEASFFTTVDDATKTISLSNYSYGSIAKFFWNFGDGNASTVFNPTHKYNAAGSYDISLTVIDSIGTCIHTLTEKVTVGDIQCKAAFTYFIDSLKQEGSFKAKIEGAVTGIYWEFGDGTMSTDLNVTHTFANPGFYKVTLNVVDENTMCFDQQTQTIMVSSKGNDCVSDFNYLQDPATRTITVENLSKGTGLDQFIWDFGDGSVVTAASTEHTYTKSDYYMVCLTSISTGTGCKNTSCEEIKIGTDPKPCLSNFSYTVDSTTLTVALIDRSLGDITNWLWYLSETDTSHQQSAVVTFADSGYYGIRLNVSNPTSECSNDYFDVVRVGAKQVGLVAGFIFRIDSANSSKGVMPVEFKGASYGEASEAEWNFGDGTTNSTSIAPTHEYAPGDYEACLTLSNPTQGTSSTVCDSVHILVTGIQNQIEKKASLSCYPNPMHTSADIRFTIAEQSHVSIVLYDITGKKVQTLVNKEMNAGSFNTSINRNNLTAGVYYMQLKTDKNSLSQKLIILK